MNRYGGQSSPWASGAPPMYGHNTHAPPPPPQYGTPAYGQTTVPWNMTPQMRNAGGGWGQPTPPPIQMPAQQRRPNFNVRPPMSGPTGKRGNQGWDGPPNKRFNNNNNNNKGGRGGQGGGNWRQGGGGGGGGGGGNAGQNRQNRNFNNRNRNNNREVNRNKQNDTQIERFNDWTPFWANIGHNRKEFPNRISAVDIVDTGLSHAFNGQPFRQQHDLAQKVAESLEKKEYPVDPTPSKPDDGKDEKLAIDAIHEKYMKAVFGYVCQVCNLFLKDKSARFDHCKSEEHLKKFNSAEEERKQKEENETKTETVSEEQKSGTEGTVETKTENTEKQLENGDINETKEIPKVEEKTAETAEKAVVKDDQITPVLQSEDNKLEEKPAVIGDKPNDVSEEKTVVTIVTPETTTTAQKGAASDTTPALISQPPTQPSTNYSGAEFNQNRGRGYRGRGNNQNRGRGGGRGRNRGRGRK